MKNFCVHISLALIALRFGCCDLQAESMRPAMVAKGSDSFAAQLHYPEKAKSARKQAAITFYCEIGTDGRPSKIELPAANGRAEFSSTVEQALRNGRFEPAMIDGKPVPVIIGGTVLFLFNGSRPQIVVSLCTTDKEKIVRMANYIQPQMISSKAELRRKVKNQSSAGTSMAASPMEPSLISYRTFDIDYVPAGHSSAEVLMHVDQHGNLTGTRILAESPPNGGLGRSLAKAVEGARFIPAMHNGRPAAGDFNLPIAQSAW